MQTRLKQASIGFYLSGLFILTSGIALSIIATLGTSPFDALLVGLHRTFGLTVGSWEIVVGGTMVFCNAFVERKRPEYFALITSFITGIGIDFWLFVIRHLFIPTTWVGYWLLLILSLFLCGLGIAIYLQSRIAPNPTDRSMLIVSKLTGFNLTYSRALVNGVLVVIAFQFNGAIGIGTLVIAVLSGSFITMFFPFFQQLKENSSIKQKHKRPA